MGLQQGFVEVELNGQTKLIRLDFNAYADLEEHLGKGISAIMQEDNVGFRTIRGLYWAGLRWKDKGLTVERTGAMLEAELLKGKTFAELMEPIGRAFQASGIMKGNKEKEETEENPKN